jgi:hypothetical protein
LRLEGVLPQSPATQQAAVVIKAPERLIDLREGRDCHFRRILEM